MEEEKKATNPEVAVKETEETIIVKVLVKGEPSDSNATTFTI